MPMTQEQLKELPIEEQAWYWVEWLHAGDIDQPAELIAWLQQSPAHEQAFRSAHSFDKAFLEPALRACHELS